MSEIGPDKADRFNLEVANVSVSAPFYGLLGGKVSFFSDGESPHHEFEERVAITQYDGNQNPTQAQRIAYQDAFMAVLCTLPYEENYGKDWLQERIKAAQIWLVKQGLEQPE